MGVEGSESTYIEVIGHRTWPWVSEVNATFDILGSLIR